MNSAADSAGSVASEDASAPSTDPASAVLNGLGRTEHPRPPLLSRLTLAGLMTVIFLAVFFRFWQLDTIPGINGDEAWLGWKAVRAAEGHGLNWRTNTNNLTNPFFILPSITVHAVLEPSGVALRLVSVISGVLLLPVVFLLVRPLYGVPAAWIGVLLSALLPINILYARFGWEPAQSVLFAWPVVCLALGMARGDGYFWRWALAAGLAWIAAMLVHPTSFFLTPVLVIAALPEMWRRVPPGRARWVVIGVAVFLLLFLAGTGWWALQKIPYYIRDQILARWQTGSWGFEAQLFATNMARLFTGAEITTVLGGSPDWRASWWGQTWSFLPVMPRIDLFFWAVTLLAGVVVSWPRRGTNRAPSARFAGGMMDAVLVIYILLSTGLFFVLCGAAQLQPGVERYGLWMIPGVTLLWARAGGVLWARGQPWRIGLIAGGAVLSLGVLGFFYQSYFRYFERTGGSGSLAGRTARIEPKFDLVQRARQIKNTVDAGEYRVVLASADWFLIWPVAYFSQRSFSGENTVTPIFLEPWKRLGTLEEYEEALDGGETVWRAEFADQTSLEETRTEWRERGFAWKEEVLTDPMGRPVIVVLQRAAADIILAEETLRRESETPYPPE